MFQWGQQVVPLKSKQTEAEVNIHCIESTVFISREHIINLGYYQHKPWASTTVILLVMEEVILRTGCILLCNPKSQIQGSFFSLIQQVNFLLTPLHLSHMSTKNTCSVYKLSYWGAAPFTVLLIFRAGVTSLLKTERRCEMFTTNETT